MSIITILSKNHTCAVELPDGALLSEAITRAGCDFPLPCAGNHTCGKCRVTVRGAVSTPDAHELAHLSDADRAAGIRLACSCRAEGDCTVELHTDEHARILTWAEALPVVCTQTGCGLAVDIGTTTVVMRLYDRSTGTVLAERAEENRQRRFGADVISRISACAEVGLSTVQAAICDQLEELAAQCMAESGVSEITESVVTGNSTMLHLFEGLDPASLAVSPFKVQSDFGRISTRTLAGAPVYLPRCTGAYVGADITCAILASGMADQSNTSLLADIGTNGEMALMHNGELVCCSTAAGPAFEGAGLSCGMPAADGAIRTVSCDAEDNVTFEVIGGGEPTGICGSGVLDALAVMLKLEELEDSGFLEEDFMLTDRVGISTKDVRQLQLAKAAVCAGILTLSEERGVELADIDTLYIAGGFGSSMNPQSAGAIGLIPPVLADRVHFLGNAALAGAAMLLLQPELRDRAFDLSKNATELALSTSETFMDYYVECMMFGEEE